jgi:DNA-binding transcriptional ArsR family regulator
MHTAVSPPSDRAAEGLPAAVAAVSPQGWTVLGALRAVADGQLSIAEVSRGVRRPGASAAVARASLSRTLRRLWRAGLVACRDDAVGSTEARPDWRAALVAALHPEYDPARTETETEERWGATSYGGFSGQFSSS